MNITPDIKFLRGLMPNAVITSIINDRGCTDYECDMRHTQITDKESDDLFPPIKKHFGERLMERYSYSTSHFIIYLKKPKYDASDYSGGISLAKSHELSK